MRVAVICHERTGALEGNTMDGHVWHLAQVKPNAYRIAQRNLERQGFSVFNPLQDLTRKTRGQFVTRPLPLFPGYLFVCFDPLSGGYRQVNATLGISRLVSFGERPAEVPGDLIAALMSRCDAQGRMVQPAEVQAGDRVRFVKGPFADFVATIDSIESDRRIWVLMDLLGRDTRISIERGGWQLA